MNVSRIKLGKAAPPIGVDVGRQSVRLAQLDKLGPGGRVVRTARQALPTGVSPHDEGYDQWITQAVKSALEQGGFNGRRCVSALPSGVVAVKNLRLPRMPADELRDAVAWEMRERINAKDRDLLVQFLSAGEVRQGEDVREEVIALAAETAFIERHVDALVAAGLAPVAVEVDVTALARAFAEQTEAGVHVITDIGHDTSKIVIVRDGQVVFFKRLEIAGRAFDQSVAQHVSMPVEEARALRRDFTLDSDVPTQGPNRALYEALRVPVGELAREVELCLRYFGVTFRGARPERLTLVGGESMQSWLPRLLGEQGTLAVEVGDPTRGELADDGAGWAVAVGLAGRAETGWGERRGRGRAAA